MRRTATRWVGMCLVILVLLGASVSCGSTRTPDQSTAQAVNFPEQDITFVVPFKPGGGLDTQARLMAPYIKKYLPKAVNVVVLNESAAGGKVGALKVFDAKPDGHTIGLLPPTSIGLLAVRGEFDNRDPGKYEYFARTGYAPYMLVVSQRSRFKSIQDMKGQEVRFGGTTAVIFQAALLAEKMGAKIVYVTYDGFPETAMAAMRGDIDVFFFNWDSGIKHVQSSEGKLIPLLMAAESRVPQMANVPTAKEAGLSLEPAVMAVMAAGNMVVAPPGIAPAVKQILEKAIAAAVSDPALEAEMQKANYSVQPILTPAQTREVALGAYNTMEQFKALLNSVQR